MRSLLNITLSVILVLSLSLVSGAVGPKDETLIGLWLCDDGKGEIVTDSSGNENHGVINGAFKWDKGKFDGCIVSPGAGSIDVKTSDSINSIKNAITIAGWFRVDAASDTGVRRQNAYLLEDQSTSEFEPDGWSFRIWTTSGLSPGIYGPTKVKVGEWTHIAGTYDGKVMKLYINGVEEKELYSDAKAKVNGEWTGTIQTPADQLQLKYGSETYTGGMDEIVIFSRALTADEIKRLTNGWKKFLSVSALNRLACTWGGLKSMR